MPRLCSPERTRGRDKAAAATTAKQGVACCSTFCSRLAARRHVTVQNPGRRPAVAINSKFDCKRHRTKRIDALLVIKLAAPKHVPKTYLDVLQHRSHADVDIRHEWTLVYPVTLPPRIPIEKNIVQHKATIASPEKINAPARIARPRRKFIGNVVSGSHRGACIEEGGEIARAPPDVRYQPRSPAFWRGIGIELKAAFISQGARRLGLQLMPPALRIIAMPDLLRVFGLRLRPDNSKIDVEVLQH